MNPDMGGVGGHYVFSAAQTINSHTEMLRQAACWFPAAQPQNNHTATTLIKSLLGPLALASYWLTLTY